MTQYSYAELEGLWIQAGGSRALAPVMAAIAEAESSGNSQAHNPSGATGLWQILGNPFPGNAYDPLTNAKMAAAKLRSQGLGAWVTYTSGAYKAFLSSKTTPVIPAGGTGGGGAGTPATTAAIVAYDPTTCVWTFPGIAVPFLGNVGEFCLFEKHQARALIGGMIMVFGVMGLGLPGAALIIAAAGLGALGAAGPVLAKTGAAVALIPGAEAAGVAIAGAGQAGSSSARQTQARRQRGAAQDAAYEREFGGVENPELDVGRGAIRESPEGTRRRRQAAARSRARRYTTDRGEPASADEAGF
jgi:hypothetical protein